MTTLTYPATLTPELKHILGRPCFTCIQIARRLRELGHTIETSAEVEQAYVIDFLLRAYLEAGTDYIDLVADRLGLWVACAERLPPEGVVVDIEVREGQLAVSVGTATCRNGSWHSGSEHVPMSRTPTHWRRIVPTLPKDGVSTSEKVAATGA